MFRGWFVALLDAGEPATRGVDLRRARARRRYGQEPFSMILAKLGVRDRVRAVLVALEHGLL
jgi:hypothetical protein